MILPVLTLTAVELGYVARMTRASMDRAAVLEGFARVAAHYPFTERDVFLGPIPFLAQTGFSQDPDCFPCSPNPFHCSIVGVDAPEIFRAIIILLPVNADDSNGCISFRFVTMLLVSIFLFVLLESRTDNVALRILGVFATQEQLASYRLPSSSE